MLATPVLIPLFDNAESKARRFSSKEVSDKRPIDCKNRQRKLTVTHSSGTAEIHVNPELGVNMYLGCMPCLPVLCNRTHNTAATSAMALAT
jgi:hypothetical protein